MEREVITREDNSEIFQYDFENYFAYSHIGKAENYPNQICRAHWHEDLEFILVLSGNLTDYINGIAVPLRTGQGILINSKQLHESYYNDPHCTYHCTLLHPMLLCASRQIEREYVDPVLSGPPYILLDSGVDWQKKIMDRLMEIYQWRDRDGAPLKIQSLFNEIWLSLYERLFQRQRGTAFPKGSDRGLTVLKEMILYVQRNYREKICLEDIARAGTVSKSTCLSLFKKYLRDTPVNYLILYRLKKAAGLLRSTDLSVTDTAFETGFSNISYFIKTFRGLYACSPLEYRKSGPVQEERQGT